ncbi:MAG: carboxypeptidase regulatory-like domain-containing protein [Candidatus Eisenbacteria sp.]|nr:carboxypeptidase regulatory-like domain-containing protein [Candidatus Eisenbacteria bacterium]
MRSWRLVALLILVVLLPFACSKNDDPMEPGDENGVLMGRVVDSSGEDALGGVVVRLEGTDQTAVTAADGSFEFTDLPGGDFTVVVEPPDGAPYQSNRIEISVHPGGTVAVDCTVLPDSAAPGPIAIYPQSARVGVLESVQFYIGGAGGWIGIEGGGQDGVPYRPTWSIRSEHAIGVLSREGIFIGTAVGSGQVVASLSASVNAIAEIEVVADGDVARIIVHPPYMVEVLAGESRYLAAYAINGAGDVASGVSLMWSVDPATLGTIEPATDLTPEERAEILARLWYGMDDGWGGPTDDDTITVPGDSGGTRPPDPLPPDVDLSDISIVRFTAEMGVQGEARGEIKVGVEGASWAETVGVSVLARGTLTTVYLHPEEVGLALGSEAFFFAYGLNEWDRPIGGLAYAWSVEPASLGTIEEMEGPWMGPNDPADGRPSPDWRGGVVLRATEEGEGTVGCVVTDSLTGASIERTAIVRVAPAPVLDRIQVRPNPIEATLGDSLLVEAVALNTWNDVDWSAQILWSYEGNAGVFVPFDGPHPVDPDSTWSPGGPGDPTDPSIPGSSYGMAYGYFLANNPGGTGTLTATATATGVPGVAGVTVTIDVPIRVLAR